MPTRDPFGARASLGPGLPDVYRLAALAGAALDLDRMPRHAQDPARERPAPRRATASSPRATSRRLAGWRPASGAERGDPVPAVAGHPPGLHGRPGRRRPRRDARRDGRPRRRSAARVNPLVPADLVIDHSVQVDRFGTADAFAFNVGPRVRAQRRALPAPALGPARLSRPAGRPARDRDRPPGQPRAPRHGGHHGRRSTAGRSPFPTRWSGTDSHTTMVNALGVLGYGVGGIEAEAVLLGQPLYQPMPAGRRRPASRRAAAGSDGDRPRPRRHGATPQGRRRRLVRRVRGRRPGGPGACPTAPRSAT